MKIPSILITSLAAASILCGAAAQAQTKTVDSMPPVVVKTVPQSGAKDVEAGTVEVKVTFSKEMADNSWSWSTAWPDSAPEMIGKPKYDALMKTCSLKVKLEPGKTYAWWINSGKFQGFRDTQGHPSVPYLFIFQTK